MVVHIWNASTRKVEIQASLGYMKFWGFRFWEREGRERERGGEEIQASKTYSGIRILESQSWRIFCRSMIVNSDRPPHKASICSARPSHPCAQPKCLQHHSVLSLCRLSSLTPSVWYRTNTNVGSITGPESVRSQVLMQTQILNLQFPSLVPGCLFIYAHPSLRHFDLSHWESNLLSLMKHNSLLKNLLSAVSLQA